MHWSISPLGEIADTALGKMLDRGKPMGYRQVRYLRNINVQWGCVDTGDLLTMEIGEEERHRFAVEPGDLLVCEGGDIGRAAIWRGDGHGYIAYQKALHRIRSRGLVDVTYLRYLFEHFSSSGMLHRYATGSTIQHLPQEALRQLPVPFPSLAIQRDIVEALEGHFSRLEAADSSISITDARLRSMQRALWKRRFDDLQVRFGLTPLLSVASIANGQTPKGLTERLSLEPGPERVPFFKVGDMNASDGRLMSVARFFVSRRDAEDLGLRVRRPGTVLLPKRGGAIATNKKRLLGSDACYDLNTMGIIPDGSLSPDYLLCWLEGIDLGQLADGSNVPQINAPQIRSLELPVPSMALQEQIVMEVEGESEALASLRGGCAKVSARSKRLRGALLAAAFTGKLAASGNVSEVVRGMAGV